MASLMYLIVFQNGVYPSMQGLFVLVLAFKVVDVVVCGVEVDPSLHTEDSSPMEAKTLLFILITAALLDTPATPVGVPVPEYMTSGFE